MKARSAGAPGSSRFAAKVPCARTETTSPAARSSSTAFIAVSRFAPHAAAISLSDGSRAPGAIAPERSFARRSAAIFR